MVVVGGIVVVDVVVVLDVLVVGGTVDVVVVVVVVAALGGPNVQPASPGHSAIRARVALRHRIDIGPTVPPLPAK